VSEQSAVCLGVVSFVYVMLYVIPLNSHICCIIYIIIPVFRSCDILLYLMIPLCHKVALELYTDENYFR